MAEDIVNIYASGTLVEAHILSDLLAAQQIKCFVENEHSPFDGLIAGDQQVNIFVLPEDVELAIEIASAYAHDVQA